MADRPVESARHSELREDVAFIRQGPAHPDKPWHEFITFAETLPDDVGPMFGDHAARVGRYVRSLEEQLEAVRRERDEAREFARQAVDNWIRPALQELGQAVDRLRCHGQDLPTIEEVQGILADSSPATTPESDRTPRGKQATSS